MYLQQKKKKNYENGLKENLYQFLLCFAVRLKYFTRFYQVLPGFTRFYQVLPGFTRFYQVLPSFTRVAWKGCYQVRISAEIWRAEWKSVVGAAVDEPVVEDD